MTRRYLALYDYGSGGVWLYVLGDSRRQIAALFPELEVFAEPPSWMSPEELQRIRRDMTFDVRQPRGWLAELQHKRARLLNMDPEREGERSISLREGPSAQHEEVTLTRRELEVLGHLASGISQDEIARRLEISPKTVAAHITSIVEKLRGPRAAVSDKMA
jgi:DNA-binding CsgD family transcriptional regulator